MVIISLKKRQIYAAIVSNFYREKQFWKNKDTAGKNNSILICAADPGGSPRCESSHDHANAVIVVKFSHETSFLCVDPGNKATLHKICKLTSLSAVHKIYFANLWHRYCFLVWSNSVSYLPWWSFLTQWSTSREKYLGKATLIYSISRLWGIIKDYLT